MVTTTECAEFLQKVAGKEEKEAMVTSWNPMGSLRKETSRSMNHM